MAPFWLLGMMEFVRSALVLSLLPIYGQYEARFSLSVIGMAISFHYLADNLFRIPAGWINDRFGGKWLVLTGILLSGCGILLMFILPNAWLFALGAVLFGLGISPVWPVVIALVSARMPLDQMGEALSKVFIAWLVGSGLGPVLINFILGKSYALSFRVLLGVIILAWLLSLTIKFPAIHHIHQKTVGSFLRELYTESSDFKVLYPGMFVQTMSIGILLPVITVYAKTVFGISLEQFSYLLVGGGIFTVVLLIPAGKLADRLGVKGPLVGGLASAALFLLLLPLQKKFAHALIIGAFIGISYAYILPAWNGLMARVISPEKRGTIWAVFMTIEGVGTAAGSYAGTAVWDRFGYQAPFFLSASILAAMAFVYYFIDMNALMKKNQWVERLPGG